MPVYPGALASLQSQLPFHLARSFYLAWLTPPAGGVYCVIQQARFAPPDGVSLPARKNS
jgi:hypothetical protein